MSIVFMKIGAYSSAAEHPAHNWSVAGSNPAGPTLRRSITAMPLLLSVTLEVSHGFF